MVDETQAAKEEADLRAVAKGLEQSLAGEGRPAAEFFEEFETRVFGGPVGER